MSTTTEESVLLDVSKDIREIIDIQIKIFKNKAKATEEIYGRDGVLVYDAKITTLEKCKDTVTLVINNRLVEKINDNNRVLNAFLKRLNDLKADYNSTYDVSVRNETFAKISATERCISIYKKEMNLC